MQVGFKLIDKIEIAQSYSHLNFSGKSTDSFIQTPERSDSTKQRRKIDCVPWNHHSYGMFMDEKIRNAKMECQP